VVCGKQGEEHKSGLWCLSNQAVDGSWPSPCGQVHDGEVCAVPAVPGTNGCWGHYGPEVDPEASFACNVATHVSGQVPCPHCVPIPGRPGVSGEADTSPREPRVWRAGDPEPGNDVKSVRHSNSQVFTRRQQPGMWQAGRSGALLRWDELASAARLGHAYVLTEVPEVSSPQEGDGRG